MKKELIKRIELGDPICFDDIYVCSNCQVEIFGYGLLIDIHGAIHCPDCCSSCIERKK